LWRGKLQLLEALVSEAVCCTLCQSIGLKRYVRSGSVKKGLLLLALFIVPGVLYFLWLFLEGHWGCSTCGSRKVVPIVDPDTITVDAKTQGNFAQGL
jgi:hypothetical protein